MSFYHKIEQYRGFDFEDFFAKVTPQDVERILNKERLGELDFLALLSAQAAEYLEPMAQKARQLTIQYFGRTIQLYIPLYISNHCTNECLYCGFNRSNGIQRKKLTLAEIEAEAKAIARSGMQHLLLLTGEATAVTPLDYLEAAVRVLKRYFASVSIEVFPMD
jgi:2-iminoacetate synthase